MLDRAVDTDSSSVNKGVLDKLEEHVHVVERAGSDTVWVVWKLKFSFS